MHSNPIPPATCSKQSLPRINCVLAPAASDLAEGLEQIKAGFANRFGGTDALSVRLEPQAGSSGSLEITRAEENGSSSLLVRYGDAASAFRAIGIILGRLQAGLPLDCKEQRGLDTIGIMLDASRNGVLRPETLQRLIRHFALMGINQLMLYTEDTYEVPGEPLFGYFRGRYTQEELRAIDDYAFLFGIEVVPCIQTLGHLEQVLKWVHYRPLQDIGGVLLSGDEQTDHFIEKTIAAASAPFRSRRIHIGMDEADGVGAGIYRVRNGAQPPFEILLKHLSKTTDTCHRLGLKPMIWSDMFFRLGSKTHDYYDPQAVISAETIASVPSGVDFVYWDYYHTDSSFYTEWIKRHRTMGTEPIYAAGIWGWNRWWTQLEHSITTLRAGMQAAREANVKEAFATVWGDDGMEVDIFSILPGVQFFAEMAYAGDAATAERNLAPHLLGSCGVSATEWIKASQLDLPPADAPLTSSDPAWFFHSNASKWLLWHDPLLSFLDRHIKPAFAPHYEQLARELEQGAALGGGNERLLFAARVAGVLALKCRLHHELRPAYQAQDKQTLRELQSKVIPQLQEAVAALRDRHQALWGELYRPFGWETLERRYAGLLSRLGTLSRKLDAHLTDPSVPIEELACETTEIWPQEEFYRHMLRHNQVATASCIS